MTIETEIAARLSDLLGRKALFLQEMVNWLTGTVDGGPLGDGRYPITIGGEQTLLPSPAKSLAGGALTAAGVAQLPIAAPADVPADLQVLGVSGTGEPMRFSTHLFPSRKTADFSVLPGSEYAEWLLCLSSTGLERKIAVDAITRTVGGIIDPSLPPFNVKFDYKKTKPCDVGTGSNVITTREGNVFDQGDVGKVFAMSFVGGPNNVFTGFIGQVVNGSQIKVYADRAFTTPVLATWDSQPGGEELVCGTDSTAGLQGAFTAAEAAAGVYTIGRVVLLSGMCCVTNVRFGSIAIVGLAENSSGLVALPTYGSERGQAVLQDKREGKYAQLRADNYTLRNFSVLGQKFTSSSGTYRPNIYIGGGEFANFTRGAPYATISGIVSNEAVTDGIYTRGAFAGSMSHIYCGSNNRFGMLAGFWDLNGFDWHCEANGQCGIYSIMPGANVEVVRSSYNGVSGGSGAYELGSNLTETGAGNTWTNIRMQESWGHNLVITSRDALGDVHTGQRNSFRFGTFDDTSDIVPTGFQNKENYPGAPALPSVRAMVCLLGDQCWGNEVSFSNGSGQVFPDKNSATNAVAIFSAYNNIVSINTPGIGPGGLPWYAGGSNPIDTPAANPTAYGNFGAGPGNIVTINGQTY